MAVGRSLYPLSEREPAAAPPLALLALLAPPLSVQAALLTFPRGGVVEPKRIVYQWVLLRLVAVERIAARLVDGRLTFGAWAGISSVRWDHPFSSVPVPRA
jgi:hypothetical protein